MDEDQEDNRQETMEHRGLKGSVKHNKIDNLYYGKVLGVKALIGSGSV